MWYYSNNGEQQGPFDDAAWNGLVAEGVVHSDTFVWKEGFSEWTMLSQVPAFQGLGTIGGEASPICSSCGKRIGAENLIEWTDHRVCAACRPITVQKMHGEITLEADTLVWRDRKKVKTYNRETLPARCYKCNHPVEDRPFKRKLYWHHPAYYLLILLKTIPYFIVALIVRSRATVFVYLCPRHAKRRKYFMIGFGSLLVLGIVLTLGGMMKSESIWMDIGLFIIGIAIAVGRFGTRFVGTSRIHGDTVWLKGAGKKFLESLPPSN